MDEHIAVADWIAYHARVTPSRIACIDLASARERTYAALDSRISRLSAYLRSTLGLKVGARVLVLSKNDIDVFEIQFACQRAGLIFVPVNWRLTLREIDFIVKDCDADVLFFGEEFREAADHIRDSRLVKHLIEMKCGRSSDYEDCISNAPSSSIKERRIETDTWALIYTSGTTGHPKGAMISYRMALYNAVTLCAAFNLDGDSCNLVVLPTFHTGGLNVFANPTFYRGGTNIVLRDFVPDNVVRLLGSERSQVTHMLAVPTMHAMLAAEPGFGRIATGRLRGLAVAGAACPTHLIAAYAEIGIALRQCWGMTEAGPLATITPAENPVGKRGSSGLPGMFVEAAIADIEGNIAPDGQVGELIVKGPVVTRGYWKRDDVNRQVFNTAGWFRTGDAAYRDEDGYYYIVDRWKDMYISGGENIYPAEIERVLYLHDGVAECAVVAKSDEKWGEVGRAFVVCKEGITLGHEILTAHCGGHLARYKIPKEFVFVTALPRNASGKILKTKLREHP